MDRYCDEKNNNYKKKNLYLSHTNLFPIKQIELCYEDQFHLLNLLQLLDFLHFCIIRLMST